MFKPSVDQFQGSACEGGKKTGQIESEHNLIETTNKQGKEVFIGNLVNRGRRDAKTESARARTMKKQRAKRL